MSMKAIKKFFRRLRKAKPLVFGGHDIVIVDVEDVDKIEVIVKGGGGSIDVKGTQPLAPGTVEVYQNE